MQLQLERPPHPRDPGLGQEEMSRLSDTPDDSRDVDTYQTTSPSHPPLYTYPSSTRNRVHAVQRQTAVKQQLTQSLRPGYEGREPSEQSRQRIAGFACLMHTPPNATIPRFSRQCTHASGRASQENTDRALRRRASQQTPTERYDGKHNVVPLSG